MTTIYFKSTYNVIDRLPIYSQSVIKAEPQLWRADRAFALDRGGPITKDFLQRLPDHGEAMKVLDSRVHMLMPGMYPCIPGWHLDDIPRTRPDGQPDHVRPVYKSVHYAACLGDASLTHFIYGPLALTNVPTNRGIVYQQWHKDIEDLVNAGVVSDVAVRESELVKFGWGSFHRGEAATKHGWRMFIRASYDTDLQPMNEVRTQTQVYMTEPFVGW